MFVLKRRNTAVNCLAFSPDGTTLAAAGYWGYAHLWDLNSRSLRYEWRLGTQNVSAVFFGPGGRVVAFNGWLAPFDAVTGEYERPPRRNTAMPALVCAAPGGLAPHYCLVNWGTMALSCYTFPERQKVWTRRLPADGFVRKPNWFTIRTLVTTAAYSSDSTAVVVGCCTGAAHVVRAADGVVVGSIPSPGQAEVKAVALSPDGSRLAACAGSHLRLYRVTPAVEEVRHVSLGRTHFRSVAWHPGGAFFATANGDGKVDFWDAATGERRSSFDWGIGKVQTVAFDAAGDRAACGSEPGDVVVWDVDR